MNQAYYDDSEELGTTNRPEYCNGCFNNNFQLIIQQFQLCKSNDRIRLLMFITSTPNNKESRVVIRKTWAAKCWDPNSVLKCVFVLGRSKNSSVNMNLITENKTYGDIIQIDFMDSYRNLTYKTMSSFKWAAEYCSNAHYVMKTDDDMYVNTELITQMLQAAPRGKFVGGYCWDTSKPNRDHSSKWFVSYRMFQKPHFPPMCSGTGYILSMDVVGRILMESPNIPFLYLEDVYVSLCLQKFGIIPKNLLGFSNTYTWFDACSYKNLVMTSHKVPSQMLKDSWPMIQDCPCKNVAPMYIVLPYPDNE
ncbi:hypothetical protein LOTGIDRAFT_106925 [Lottia gigantea]|uniref:Hexosyltransferase n=1 Tax=Lottia gigantea TaxID=225164 RepID=V4BE83_LOTGI|nr:hypothetical protein LOTGIDRAFT_106925 [Lottia gigantea]ESO87144.1 hypothetical protein LOTGIDRAFT_106925 [Lottia gigantea]